jgi:hypothetical protein
MKVQEKFVNPVISFVLLVVSLVSAKLKAVVE